MLVRSVCASHECNQQNYTFFKICGYESQPGLQKVKRWLHPCHHYMHKDMSFHITCSILNNLTFTEFTQQRFPSKSGVLELKKTTEIVLIESLKYTVRACLKSVFVSTCLILADLRKKPFNFCCIQEVFIYSSLRAIGKPRLTPFNLIPSKQVMFHRLNELTISSYQMINSL